MRLRYTKENSDIFNDRQASLSASYFARHWYITRMLFLFNCMSLLCHTNIICASLVRHLYVTRMSFVCHSYVFVCHSYVTRMYSYVTLMSLVCTRMSLLSYSYVLVCHSYVTRMCLYHEPSFNDSRVNFLLMKRCTLHRVVFYQGTSN